MAPSLDPASPVPLYHQLAEALRYRIATGALAPGTALPPLRAAARQWGVNLHTVRHAYAALASLGLVRTRAPHGTLVLGGAPRRGDSGNASPSPSPSPSASPSAEDRAASQQNASAWTGSFRTPEGWLRLTQSGDRVTGLFGVRGRIGRLWGRIEDGAVEFRWVIRASDGGEDEQGRGRLRRTSAPDGSLRLNASLGSGEAVTGYASWILRPSLSETHR
jgi:regulatory GntR family protein